MVQTAFCCLLPSAADLPLCWTSCATKGGCFMWQPSQTPSPLSGTTTGQRFVLRRSY